MASPSGTVLSAASREFKAKSYFKPLGVDRRLFFDLKAVIATINMLKAINSDNTSYVLMCFSAVKFFHRHHLRGAGASQPCGFT